MDEGSLLAIGTATYNEFSNSKNWCRQKKNSSRGKYAWSLTTLLLKNLSKKFVYFFFFFKIRTVFSLPVENASKTITCGSTKVSRYNAIYIPLQQLLMLHNWAVHITKICKPHFPLVSVIWLFSLFVFTMTLSMYNGGNLTALKSLSATWNSFSK